MLDPSYDRQALESLIVQNLPRSVPLSCYVEWWQGLADADVPTVVDISYVAVIQHR